MRPSINQTDELDSNKLHLWRTDDVAHTYRS